VRPRKFFSETSIATDEIYRVTQESQSKPYPEAREFIEHIYQETHAFLDPDLAERAPTNGLASACSEMYLAYTLKEQGLALVPRSCRVPRRAGPDLFTERPDVWIEAVIATNGDGPDRLQAPEPGKVYSIPDNDYVLRLRSSFEDKAAKIEGYMKRGYIRDGQAAVIAISGALLEFRFSELPIPRLVRALFGVGNPIVELDRETGSTVGHSVEHRDRVAKVGGAAVQTDPFLNPAYAHVSAVMYTPSCWVCHAFKPGEDFTVVHNPQAMVPLPDGWLPAGDEYWFDDFSVRRTRHSLVDIETSVCS
jgi:hypothetical protein